MSIAKRIEEAITKMDAGDFEGALIHVSIAVDATATQEYPNMKNNTAYKNFIHNNFEIISKVSSGGSVTIGNLFIKYAHPDIIPNQDGMCSIEQILYHVVRCGLLHKAKLPSDLKFINKGMISVKNNSLILPAGFIYGLLVAVVVSPSNKNQRISSNSIFNIPGHTISINELWGNKEKLLRLYAGQVDDKSKAQHLGINIDMLQNSKEDKCLETTKNVRAQKRKTKRFKSAVIALVVALLGGGIPAWLSLRDKADIPKAEKGFVVPDPNNYSRTPLYFRTKKRVDDFYESIRNEKLDPWLFINVAGVEVRVTKYNGDVINHKGILFTGAPRNNFWSDDFIPPFIEDAIIKVFDQTIDECRKNGLDPAIYVYEAKRILGDFIYKIYNHMADMDQKLLKQANPEISGRRDVSLEIEKMRKYLDEQYNAALLLATKGKNTN